MQKNSHISANTAQFSAIQMHFAWLNFHDMGLSNCKAAQQSKVMQ